jgi:hypothetical protein
MELQERRSQYQLKPRPLADLLKAPKEAAEREANTVGGVRAGSKAERPFAEYISGL